MNACTDTSDGTVIGSTFMMRARGFGEQPAGERFAVACRGGATKEHADEKAPNAADEVALQHTDQAKHDKEDAEEISGTSGDAGRPDRSPARTTARRGRSGHHRAETRGRD